MDQQAAEVSSAVADAYSLFGIQPSNFRGGGEDALQEVRKLYYDMSLLCHPDKGGRADDMVALQRSYNIVKAGLQNIALSETRMSCVEETKCSSIADILKECRVTDNADDGNEAFDNEAFESCAKTSRKLMGCSLPGIPVAPMYVADGTQERSREMVELHPVATRDLLMRLKQEDEEEPDHDETIVCPRCDYSVESPFDMCDYGAAYSVDVTLAMGDSRIERALSELLEEREVTL